MLSILLTILIHFLTKAGLTLGRYRIFNRAISHI